MKATRHVKAEASVDACAMRRALFTIYDDSRYSCCWFRGGCAALACRTSFLQGRSRHAPPRGSYPRTNPYSSLCSCNPTKLAGG